MNSPQSRLGRYLLLRRLAAGGMGEVYLAKVEGAANFTKHVAIKRILPHLAQDEGFVRRFIDEAHLMVQLHHGNIVPVLELADEGGELFLVMEYLPGRDLKAVIHRLRADKTAMPPELAVWLIAEVCAGLDYAHRKVGADGAPLNIVHRDVSPSNIVLGAGGEVKVVDFGIARARGGLHQSISGALQGKFVYMSPEQADGRSVDPRSDVFSAGLVLYELLCALRPFEGDSETETLRLVRQGRVEPPSRIRPELGETYDGLVMKALAFKPEDRYASASEMRRALVHHLAVTGSHADAGSLARFLAERFPEGVVPQATDGPRSLDEALLQQLGALTPSVDARTRTRTASAPAGAAPLDSTPTPFAATSPSAPVVLAPFASVDALTPSGVVLTPSVTAPPVPAGRKRNLALGGALGVLLAGAVAAAWLWPREATVVGLFEPAEAAAHLEVGGATLGDDARLEAGRTYELCAVAEGYQRVCRKVRLKAGGNEARFSLVPRPELSPRIEPAGVTARITLDGAELTTLPFPLERERTYTLCVGAAGHRTTCRQILATDGLNAPHFVLEALVPDAGPPDATPVDAEPPPPDAARAPPHRRRAPKPTFVTLDAYVTAEVLLDGDVVGVTPLKVRVGTQPLRFVLRAKGYAPTPHVVRPGDSGTVKLELAKPARLTLRVVPPASEIYLDGQKIGTGWLDEHITTPGAHQLELRYYRDGQLVGRVGPRDLVLEAGKESQLGEIRVPLGGPPGGSP